MAAHPPYSSSPRQQHLQLDPKQNNQAKSPSTYLLIISPILLTSPLFKSLPSTGFPRYVALNSLHGNQTLPTPFPTTKSASKLTLARSSPPPSLFPGGGVSSLSTSVYFFPSPSPSASSRPAYGERSQGPPVGESLDTPSWYSSPRGLNCAANPAPPSVVVSRWPAKSAALCGSAVRVERDDPPRRRSSVVVQGGGTKGLRGGSCYWGSDVGYGLHRGEGRVYKGPP